MLENYRCYKSECELFGYRPCNFFHFAYLYFIEQIRWIEK
jgi:hypothetical protein